MLGEDGVVQLPGEAVKVLRLGAKKGEPAWGDCTVLGELLRACGKLEDLWLLGMSTMHLEDLWEGESECALYDRIDAAARADKSAPPRRGSSEAPLASG